MKDIAGLMKGLLKATSVVSDGLDSAVADVAHDLWPDCDEDTVRIVGLRRGVLRIEVDNHARYAEAKAFHANTFLERVQARTEGATRGTDHVHKIVFQVRGMH
ncbi:MAG: hypothetical protein KDC95_14330 [Planctomycetes bacterium]|nr:hypothetical protein [Planctomycetota bacterium]